MQARLQTAIVLALVLAVGQFALARPWFGSNLERRTSPLEAMQLQLRDSQLRKLKATDSIHEVMEPIALVQAADSTTAGYGSANGYGYGYGTGPAGYGGDIAASHTRSLLAPVVTYSSQPQGVQAVVQAGALWNPTRATIELQEDASVHTSSVQRRVDAGDDLVIAVEPVLSVRP